MNNSVWQDWVLCFSTFLIGFSLLPQVWHGYVNKKKTIMLKTSLITSFLLAVQTFAIFTLKLYLAGTACLLVAIIWMILFIQGIIYGSEKKETA